MTVRSLVGISEGGVSANSGEPGEGMGLAARLLAGVICSPMTNREWQAMLVREVTGSIPQFGPK